MLSRSLGRGILFTLIIFLVFWFKCSNLNIGFKSSSPFGDAPEHVVVQYPLSSPTTRPLEQPPSQPMPTASTIDPIRTENLELLNPLELSVPSSDVLLIIKTGADTFWRRMPLHLTTTLANGRVPNHVVYSDLEEKLSNGVESIDVLAKVIDVLRTYDLPAYNSYLELKSSSHLNTYREHALLPGDEPLNDIPNNTPGWRLDKYKFLPMLSHAQEYWAELKWYIYIEDDTFIFWENMLRWISNMSPDEEPSYYGAYSGDGNSTFAQGGSGIVFSRSLMRSIFGGNNVPDLERYGNYTSKACCGDIVLGQVLKDYGISVNRGEFGTGSFRPEPPWKTGFDELIWCMPVFTFHHLHQRDFVQLSELERKHDESSLSRRPVLFRDVFTALIAPHLTNGSVANWDNFARLYILTENSTSILQSDTSHNANAFQEAFRSPVKCQTACSAYDSCLSWRHGSAPGTCALDTAVKLGRETDALPAWAPKTEVVSGWMMERIETRLLGNLCETVQDP